MKGDCFVYGICYKDWAKKYKIQTNPEKCSNCGEKVYFTRPFFIKGYRGLMTEPCKSCGSDKIISRAVPVGEKSSWLTYCDLSIGLGKINTNNCLEAIYGG